MTSILSDLQQSQPTARQFERMAVRQKEQIASLLDANEQLKNQLADMKSDAQLAEKENSILKRRMEGLGKEKSIMIVQTPGEPAQISLDGPWTMGDIRMLLQPLGRAIGQHQAEIRKGFLDRHGKLKEAVEKVVEIPPEIVEISTLNEDTPPIEMTEDDMENLKKLRQAQRDKLYEEHEAQVAATKEVTKSQKGYANNKSETKTP